MLLKRISTSVFAAVSVSLSVALFAKGVAQTVKVTETDSDDKDGIKAFKTSSPFSGSNNPAGIAVGMSGPGKGKVAFTDKTNKAFSGTTGPKPSKAIGDTSVDVTFPVVGEPGGITKSDNITVVEIKGDLTGFVALMRWVKVTTVVSIEPAPAQKLTVDYYITDSNRTNEPSHKDLEANGGSNIYQAVERWQTEIPGDTNLSITSGITYLGLTYATAPAGPDGGGSRRVPYE